MAYTVITGSFIIARPSRPQQGPEPDGDTIRFAPGTPRLIDRLPRQDVAPGWQIIDDVPQINVRFEAIDALETHFQGSHQRLDLAYAARDRMIELMGFGQVTYLPTNPNKVATVEHHPVPGYVLSNGVDGNGRVIGFVYPGAAPFPDGARVRATGDDIDESINVRLLTEGHGYPIFYSSLPAELREHLRPAIRRARAGRMGMWAFSSGDPSTPAARVGTPAALEGAVIWPKLYRRLHEFFASGRRELSGFDAWLRVTKDDRILVLNHGVPNRIEPGEIGNLHDVITIDAGAGTARLEAHPDDIVILEGTDEPSQPSGPDPVSSLRLIAAVVDPIGSDQGVETVTILNAGAQAADLTGLALTDARGTTRERFPAGKLGAGDTLRLRLTSVRLNNEGDTILLLDVDGSLLDEVSYGREMVTGPGLSLTFTR